MYFSTDDTDLPGGSVGKESTCSARDTGDMGLIPELERSPGEGNGNPSSILAWKAPWPEKPDRIQSTGHKELDMTEHMQTTHVSEEHMVLKNNQLQILKIKNTSIKIKTS